MKLLSLTALRAEADTRIADHSNQLDHNDSCKDCAIARTVLALFVAHETSPENEQIQPIFETKPHNDVWVRVLANGEIQTSNKYQIVNGGPVWTTYLDSVPANLLARELIACRKEFRFAEYFERLQRTINAAPVKIEAKLRAFNFNLTDAGEDDIDWNPLDR